MSGASLTVIRQIKLKAKVTENLKKKLAAELQEALHRLELEMQQLDFQSRRFLTELEKQKSPQLESFRGHMEEEKQKRQQRRAQLIENLKEVARLEPGSEILQGTVEGLKEVRVGDDWDAITSAEILLEDGKVVELRGC